MPNISHGWFKPPKMSGNHFHLNTYLLFGCKFEKASALADLAVYIVTRGLGGSLCPCPRFFSLRPWLNRPWMRFQGNGCKLEAESRSCVNSERLNKSKVKNEKLKVKCWCCWFEFTVFLADWRNPFSPSVEAKEHRLTARHCAGKWRPNDETERGGKRGGNEEQKSTSRWRRCGGAARERRRTGRKTWRSHYHHHHHRWVDWRPGCTQLRFVGQKNMSKVSIKITKSRIRANW